MDRSLPIDAALPGLIEALRETRRAVLQAPPGAGKTTRVPLAMLRAGLCEGRILMLEPRRLAARAAAERMAQTLGEPVGRTIGYRMRGEAKTSPDTRIEVVTEGILTRMIQSDATLDGVGAVIFDEFHERSLQADLGLALTWEVREALREDLIVLVMSATLDATPVAALLDGAPVVTSQGRSFAVETRWLDRPLPPKTRLDRATADLLRHALAQTRGGVLVFLPGEAEIRRVAALLSDLPADCRLRPLFGAMDFAAQRAAIAPAAPGERKIVLATAIAETSLTIEDVRVVVDAGRARRARFDPGSGMSRLVTERVTRAEAEQRRGRAGRVAPGSCYRLWTRGEEGALRAFPPAEIEAADLTGLVLELAQWGAAPDTLAFLSPPPEGALAQARDLLRDLGALDGAGGLTPHGRRLTRVPLHPRLAHMLSHGGPDAPMLAALLADRDPLRGAPSDLSLRLEALREPGAFARRHPQPLNRTTTSRIRAEAARLRRYDGGGAWSLPQLAALAYPDRIAQRRPGDDPRYILSGGKGAVMRADDPLAAAPLIVAVDLDGDVREARIRLALPLSRAALEDLPDTRIEWRTLCEWSRRARRVVARRQRVLGAVILDDQIWKGADPDALARAALDGVRDLGLAALGFSPAARRFQARVEQARAAGFAFPEMDDASLLARAEDWLLAHLHGRTTADQLKALDLLEPLRQALDWQQLQTLDRVMPPHFVTPMGRKAPIDYSGDDPEIEVRLQEMFGLTRHPSVGDGNRPLRVTLLSPAGRPLQTTMDLPGFWTSSYNDVRKDMRGRYPRHPWPEDPTAAPPTLRAKPRRR
ncbi:ATP-dependent helicase HrpB [Brevirhabdus sp.]|uniref:ATP-dependent helicase HrpB n=1 Tax=Brevirhabdus sp. TaxID=2004514 RepID=UPI0040582257